MKIGLRTVKTAISALAMIIAEKLGLLYAPSAGIISVLSVTSTKNICHDRNLSFVILSFSNYFSVYLFYFLGFTAIAFGIFVIIYSSAVYFQLSDGIVVSSVLVTHYLVEKIFLGRLLEMSFINEYWCGTSVIS